ncbi:MAG: hypothetical protein ACR2IQ_00270 [Minisyncoccia bacterium]
MKNLKQIIPAVIIGFFAISGVLFAAWTAPNCAPGATGCNADSPVYINNEDQTKIGGFSSEYVGVLGTMFSQDSLIVGSSIGQNPTGELRVLGTGWVKGKVYIGNDSSITDSITTPPTEPAYTLTLKPSTATTNLGRGDYCTLTKAQVTGANALGCPAGAFISNINTPTSSSGVAVTCTYINPTDNPTNLGSCQ